MIFKTFELYILLFIIPWMHFKNLPTEQEKTSFRFSWQDQMITDKISKFSSWTIRHIEITGKGISLSIF